MISVGTGLQTRPNGIQLEVFGKRRVVAVPVLDRAILRLQEAEEAAVGTVAQDVAAGFDQRLPIGLEHFS